MRRTLKICLVCTSWKQIFLSWDYLIRVEHIFTRIELRREEKLGYICLSENDLISFLHLHHIHIHEEIKRRRSLQMLSVLTQEAIKNVGLAWRVPPLPPPHHLLAVSVQTFNDDLRGGSPPLISPWTCFISYWLYPQARAILTLISDSNYARNISNVTN